MKKTALVAASVIFAATLFSQEEEPRFRKIKLDNPEFAIPSENAVLGWQCFNSDWPGSLEVKDDADGKKYLVITPRPSPTQKNASGAPRVQTLVDSTPRFLAVVGDRIKVEFEFRFGGQIAAGGAILLSSKSTQWLPSFRSFKPKPGEWTKYSVECKIEEAKDKLKEGKYSIGFNVQDFPVEIRNVSLQLQSQEK